MCGGVSGLSSKRLASSFECFARVSQATRASSCVVVIVGAIVGCYTTNCVSVDVRFLILVVISGGQSRGQLVRLTLKHDFLDGAERIVDEHLHADVRLVGSRRHLFSRAWVARASRTRCSALSRVCNARTSAG